MECVAVFLLFLTVFAIVSSVLGRRASNRRWRRRLLQQLAKQFAGSQDVRGIFANPQVRLRYGETTAKVSEGQVSVPFRGRAIQVRVAWPHTFVRCEIVGGAGNRVPKDMKYAWPRIPLDDDSFGQNFVITGFAESDVLQLLTTGVRWQLDRLRQLGNGQRVYVLIHDGQIVVHKYGYRPRGEVVAQLVQGVLDLYDQCMLAKACGIEFLNADETQTLDNVTCKICGDAIGNELVYCRRCKTPHHEECWRYAGVCSVFGCRETVYSAPQSGQPLSPPHESPRPVNKPR